MIQLKAKKRYSSFNRRLQYILAAIIIFFVILFLSGFIGNIVKAEYYDNTSILQKPTLNWINLNREVIGQEFTLEYPRITGMQYAKYGTTCSGGGTFPFKLCFGDLTLANVANFSCASDGDPESSENEIASTTITAVCVQNDGWIVNDLVFPVIYTPPATGSYFFLIRNATIFVSNTDLNSDYSTIASNWGGVDVYYPFDVSFKFYYGGDDLHFDFPDDSYIGRDFTNSWQISLRMSSSTFVQEQADNYLLFVTYGDNQEYNDTYKIASSSIIVDEDMMFIFDKRMPLNAGTSTANVYLYNSFSCPNNNFGLCSNYPMGDDSVTFFIDDTSSTTFWNYTDKSYDGSGNYLNLKGCNFLYDPDSFFNIKYHLCLLAEFLFLPSQNIREEFDEATDVMRTKIPFNYFFAVVDFLTDFDYTPTEEAADIQYDFDIMLGSATKTLPVVLYDNDTFESTFNGDYMTTFRIITKIAFYFLFVFYLFNRVRKIFNPDEDVAI